MDGDKQSSLTGLDSIKNKGQITGIKVLKGLTFGVLPITSPKVTIETLGLGKWDVTKKLWCSYDETDRFLEPIFGKCDAAAVCWKTWFPVTAEISKSNSMSMIDGFLVAKELSKYDENIHNELISFEKDSLNTLEVTKEDQAWNAKINLKMSYKDCTDTIEGGELIQAAGFYSFESLLDNMLNF